MRSNYRKHIFNQIIKQAVGELSADASFINQPHLGTLKIEDKEIKIIDINALTDYLYPGEELDQYLALPYSQRNQIIEDWCSNNNSYYYTAPDDWFDIPEAAMDAFDHGCSSVVVNNLS